MGNIEYVQDALAHANTGNVNAVLTRELGEHFLKLGRAGVDFPVAPALHLAIRCGTLPSSTLLLPILKILTTSACCLHMMTVCLQWWYKTSFASDTPASNAGSRPKPIV